MAKPKKKAKKKTAPKKPKTKPVAASAPAESEASKKVRCPLPPSNTKHVAKIRADAVVGDHVACNVNHHLRVSSLLPLTLVAA